MAETQKQKFLPLEWSDDLYSVGIQKLDHQHKELFGLINALDKVGHSADHEFIDKVINTLFLYVQNHFADEERILKKMNFPHFTAHHNSHVKFAENIKAIKAHLKKDGDYAEVIDRVSIFLREWIVKHILVEDRAYRDYFLD